MSTPHDHDPDYEAPAYDRPSKTPAEEGVARPAAPGRAAGRPRPTGSWRAWASASSCSTRCGNTRRPSRTKAAAARLQFVGKLMRKVDVEPHPRGRGRAAAGPTRRTPRAAPGRTLARRAAGQRRRPHRAGWTNTPGSDVQQLRSLIRAARKDAAAAGRAARRPRLPRAVPVHQVGQRLGRHGRRHRTNATTDDDA